MTGYGLAFKPIIFPKDVPEVETLARGNAK